MPKPYSQDLRGRVVAAVAGGKSRHAVAAQFAVSVSSAVRWVQRWQASGEVAAKPTGGSISPLEQHACYNEARDRLGEDEAPVLFAEAVPKRNRGHQKGNTGRPGLYPDLPFTLLEAYDTWNQAAQSEDEKASIPRRLAARLYDDGKDTRYGASAAAIERHLRRLLKAREQRDAESAEQHRRFLAAYKTATGKDLPAALLSPPIADNE